MIKEPQLLISDITKKRKKFVYHTQNNSNRNSSEDEGTATLNNGYGTPPLDIANPNRSSVDNCLSRNFDFSSDKKDLFRSTYFQDKSKGENSTTTTNHVSVMNMKLNDDAQTRNSHLRQFATSTFDFKLEKKRVSQILANIETPKKL